MFAICQKVKITNSGLSIEIVKFVKSRNTSSYISWIDIFIYKDINGKQGIKSCDIILANNANLKAHVYTCSSNLIDNFLEIYAKFSGVYLKFAKGETVLCNIKNVKNTMQQCNPSNGVNHVWLHQTFQNHIQFYLLNKTVKLTSDPSNHVIIYK